ncbi:hypothetical protein CW696_05555 [ANME-2 cluster archaeon]|nr:MAG: hypothetical protein CW696_05555 [ANME-2 cluster archaeon]
MMGNTTSQLGFTRNIGQQASFTGGIASIGGDRIRRLFLLMVLLAFVGAASATDYYVATWGDNSSSGNFTHPWQNVSYATQQAVAGDTIYLFDGTWYDEHAVFANSGNATHPITLTAHNGTPTMEGVDKTGAGININFRDYIEISHLTICRYGHTIDEPGSYIHVSDCDLSDTDGVVIVISESNSTHNTIENCTLYDSGWNTIQVCGNREPPNGNGIPATYITVRNCTIYRNAVHGAIDFFGNLDHVEIDGCTFYSNWHGILYSHDDPDFMNHIMVHDCGFYGNDSPSVIPINFNRATNSSVYNNSFHDYTSEVVILSGTISSNFTANHNEFYNCSDYCIRVDGNGCDGAVFDGNYADDTSGNYGDKVYCFAYGADGIVKTPLGTHRGIIIGSGNSSARVEFPDNSVFTATFGGSLESSTPIRYYPTNSSCYGKSGASSGNIVVTNQYNITLRPTYAYLKDVAVNTWDEASDTYTLNVNSSQSNNPTWMNITMQNEYSSCEIYKDDILVDTKTIGTDKTLTWNYSGEFSAPHDFKFERRYGLRSSYINLTHPIIMTSSAIENNLTFSRTPDRNDNEITSFKIMVKTT